MLQPIRLGIIGLLIHLIILSQTAWSQTLLNPSDLLENIQFSYQSEATLYELDQCSQTFVSEQRIQTSCEDERLILTADFYPSNGVLQLEVNARKTMSFEGLIFSLQMPKTFASHFLSNGFQSWSNSGWLVIDKQQTRESLIEELHSDDEQRKGRGLSRNFTLLTNGTDQSLLIGVTAAKRLKSWLEIYHNETNLIVNASSGFAGEVMTIKENTSLHLDPWVIINGDTNDRLFENYAARLQYFPVRSDPKIGWNSWYYYWTGVNTDDIREHITSAPEYLKRIFSAQGIDLPEITLVIDDGWELRWGDWQANKKFSNLVDLVTEMKQANLEPGIWIAPFLVAKDSSLIKSHPDWFVRGVDYEHPSGSYRILDVSHPDAANHLLKSMRSLVNMGFKKIKIDFLMAGAFEGDRYESWTGLEAFHHGMQLIRQAVGQDTYLLACGSPLLAAFPYVNAWRIGADIAFQFPAQIRGPSWTDVANQARNISARWAFCNHIHCDADPSLLRGPHSVESALSAAWVVSFAGGGFYLSDRINKLDKKKKSMNFPSPLLQAAISAKPSQPLIDKDFLAKLSTSFKNPTITDRLFDRNSVVAPAIWRLPDNQDVLINFQSGRVNIDGIQLDGRKALLRDSQIPGSR